VTRSARLYLHLYNPSVTCPHAHRFELRRPICTRSSISVIPAENCKFFFASVFSWWKGTRWGQSLGQRLSTQGGHNPHPRLLISLSRRAAVPPPISNRYQVQLEYSPARARVGAGNAPPLGTFTADLKGSSEAPPTEQRKGQGRSDLRMLHQNLTLVDHLLGFNRKRNRCPFPRARYGR
jgi:hypothetical protein